MKIKRLALQAANLKALFDFYVHTLGFECIRQSEQFFELQCGDSILAFELGSSAYYHFAFNIWPDQIPASLAWLTTKEIQPQPFENETIVEFVNWEAQAVYFNDPLGNILEFIGRKRLGDSGKTDFSIQDVLSISEIGFANYAQQEIVDLLQKQTGIPTFGQPTEVFTALGDDQGLFILVDGQQKRWIPNMEPAIPFPYQVRIEVDRKAWDIHWDGDKLSLQEAQG